MRLAFLGTGSALSLDRYPSATLVGERLLLDAGAPLLPQLHRVGADPSVIRAILLSDLAPGRLMGMISFPLYRHFMGAGGELVVVGPAGTEERLERLLELCWGAAWPEFRSGARLRYREAEPAGEVAGIRYETGRVGGADSVQIGYRLHLEGRRVLAYVAADGHLERVAEVVRGCDLALVNGTLSAGGDTRRVSDLETIEV